MEWTPLEALKAAKAEFDYQLTFKTLPRIDRERLQYLVRMIEATITVKSLDSQQ